MGKNTHQPLDLAQKVPNKTETPAAEKATDAAVKKTDDAEKKKHDDDAGMKKKKQDDEAVEREA